MSKEIRDRVMDKVDVRSISLIMFMTVVEFEVFVFARDVVRISEQDAWFSILIGIGLLLINNCIMGLLVARFPEKNFFEYCTMIWGKPMGFVLKAGYLLYWFVTLSIIFEDFIIANKVLFLPKTPAIIPPLLLALGAFWIACYGFAAIVRFFQVMFLFLIIPLILIGILGLGQIHIENFKPFLGHNIGTILKGAVTFVGIYQGLEVILFAGPFLSNPKKIIKPVVIGTIGGTVFQFVLAVIAIGSLGVQNLKQSIWPGLDTVSIMSLPGFPVERYELFLTMPWLIGIFTSICIFLYLLAFGIKEVFNLKNRKIIIGLVVLCTVIAGYLVPNYAWALYIREVLSMVTLLFIALLPILTYILAIVRGKGVSD